jgi:hypothetical protein
MNIAKLMGRSHFIVERAKECPGEIEVSGPFIACAGWVDGHADEHFPRWSAFYVVRNDRCRVWQQHGYRGIPKAGERFTLNIHKLHGVRADEPQVLVVIFADGSTEHKATKKLDAMLRTMRRNGRLQ